MHKLISSLVLDSQKADVNLRKKLLSFFFSPASVYDFFLSKQEHNHRSKLLVIITILKPFRRPIKSPKKREEKLTIVDASIEIKPLASHGGKQRSLARKAVSGHPHLHFISWKQHEIIPAHQHIFLIYIFKKSNLQIQVQAKLNPSCIYSSLDISLIEVRTPTGFFFFN